MWLINTSSLELEFFDDPINDGIPYAILSHTWETDEVSYQVFTSDLKVAKKMLGFAKIEKTCELARSEGYNYAWVDTCCINKQSSAELSEAINSMFRWYQGSSVCYAQLSDLREPPFGGESSTSGNLPDNVEDLDKTQLKGYEEEMMKSPLAKCRWFTRGWTLQELIAPLTVVFYDASWKMIGDKRRLRHVLKIITRIGAKVLLDSGTLSSKSVWKRMSWAAGRVTTRTEDIAYALVGIFDVNLSLIYGEGYKAFQRLQEEITRRDGDPSILLWSAETMPLPRYRPPKYRHATKPPKHRGAFAWAPSEFLSREALALAGKESSVHSKHIAIQTRGDIGPQSSLVLHGGILDWPRRPGGPPLPMSYLAIQTSKGIIHRAVEKTAEGLIFMTGTATEEECGPIKVKGSKQSDLRFLSQHMVSLLEAKDVRTVSLEIDWVGSRYSEGKVWPQQRWHSRECEWVYNSEDMSKLARKLAASQYGCTVLGIYKQRIGLLLGSRLSLEDRQKVPIDVLCIVGARTAKTSPDIGGAGTAVEKREGKRQPEFPTMFACCILKHSDRDRSAQFHFRADHHPLENLVDFFEGNDDQAKKILDHANTDSVSTRWLDGNLKGEPAVLKVSCSYIDGPEELQYGKLLWKMKLDLAVITTQVSPSRGSSTHLEPADLFTYEE